MMRHWSDHEVADRLDMPAEIVRRWRRRFIEDCPHSAWDAVATRHPVGSASGLVFSHHPFGVYVDVGIPFPAALAAEHMPAGQYPRVGSVIQALVLRHDESIHQLELDARPFEP